MNSANFRFLDELNDFLPPDRKHTAFEYSFNGKPSGKHLIEALGIPHTEVSGLRVNGQPQPINYRVQPGDRIEIIPASQPGGELPETEPHFLLDNHLGQLAIYLRILGFDSLYRNDYQDEELAQVSHQEERILLTRDRRLLMRKIVIYGYSVRSLEPRQQITEVVRRYGLLEKIAPFQRCLRCNHPLSPVSKETILDRLEPLTKQYYDEYHICPGCNQIYWKGSHYERMQDLIKSVTQNGQN